MARWCRTWGSAPVCHDVAEFSGIVAFRWASQGREDNTEEHLIDRVLGSPSAVTPTARLT